MIFFLFFCFAALWVGLMKLTLYGYSPLPWCNLPKSCVHQVQPHGVIQTFGRDVNTRPPTHWLNWDQAVDAAGLCCGSWVCYGLIMTHCTLCAWIMFSDCCIRAWPGITSTSFSRSNSNRHHYHHFLSLGQILPPHLLCSELWLAFCWRTWNTSCGCSTIKPPVSIVSFLLLAVILVMLGWRLTGHMHLYAMIYQDLIYIYMKCMFVFIYGSRSILDLSEICSRVHHSFERLN